MKRIYYIGGSPCSGKSTAAEKIARLYGLYYYRVDDYLESFTERAAAMGKPACANNLALTSEENWMRDPQVQCDKEFRIYDEISEYVFEALDRLDFDGIITEGAAYTPYVMNENGFEHYICCVPTPDFQISHYSKREWVPQVLENCRNPEKAFELWMKRDILFAEKVKSLCQEKRIPCLINDGADTEDEFCKKIARRLGL